MMEDPRVGYIAFFVATAIVFMVIALVDLMWKNVATTTEPEREPNITAEQVLRFRKRMGCSLVEAKRLLELGWCDRCGAKPGQVCDSALHS